MIISLEETTYALVVVEKNIRIVVEEKHNKKVPKGHFFIKLLVKVETPLGVS